MGNGEEVRTTLDRDIILEVVEREDWREVIKYLKLLRMDLKRGFERIMGCISCQPNAVFCGEVERLGKSYNRALIAVLMLRCFLSETLGVVGDEGLKGQLNEVLKATDNLLTLLNQKHDLIHRLVEKCEPIWGGGS
jgi:hypothetical protein